MPISASTLRRRATSSGSRCRRSRRSGARSWSRSSTSWPRRARSPCATRGTDAICRIKKLEHVSEDDKTRAEKDVQKLTDEHIKQIDGLIHAKEAEIMEV